MATQRDASGTLTTEPDRPSQAKRITSRLVISLVALWFLALNLFGLMELFFMWLPAGTVAEIFEEETSLIAQHRAHFMAIGMVAWVVILSILVQLRKPERRQAPVLLIAGGVVAGTVLFGLSGTLGEWLVEEIAFVLVPIGLVVLVHPSRGELFTKPQFDRPMLGLAAVAAVPWLVYIVDHARLQLANVAGDPHAEMEHWALAGLMATFLALAAFIGSSDKPGWRLTAWMAAAGTMIFGVHSLVFPGLASAFPAFWAVAAVLWGIGNAAAIVRRSRQAATELAAA